MSRPCAFCHEPVTNLLSRARKYCNDFCMTSANYEARYRNDPPKLVTIQDPNVIRCNHCGVVMDSPRELLAHKQQLGLTRMQEQRSEFGSSLERF